MYQIKLYSSDPITLVGEEYDIMRIANVAEKNAVYYKIRNLTEGKYVRPDDYTTFWLDVDETYKP